VLLVEGRDVGGGCNGRGPGCNDGADEVTSEGLEGGGWGGFISGCSEVVDDGGPRGEAGGGPLGGATLGLVVLPRVGNVALFFIIGCCIGGGPRLFDANVGVGSRDL
jgi:hypothetical protein